MEFGKIVVALDMDESCIETLSQIKKLNISKNSEIHLVHIFEYSSASFDFNIVVPPSPDDLDKIQMIMVDKIKALKPTLGLGDHSNVVCHCIISGNAKQEFLNYADSVQAELIIAASKERKGFLGLFESSFTSFLNKFSRAHIVVLRPKPVYNVG